MRNEHFCSVMASSIRARLEAIFSLIVLRVQLHARKIGCDGRSCVSIAACEKSSSENVLFACRDGDCNVDVALYHCRDSSQCSQHAAHLGKAMLSSLSLLQRCW